MGTWLHERGRATEDTKKYFHGGQTLTYLLIKLFSGDSISRHKDKPSRHSNVSVLNFEYIIIVIWLSHVHNIPQRELIPSVEAFNSINNDLALMEIGSVC